METVNILLSNGQLTQGLIPSDRIKLNIPIDVAYFAYVDNWDTNIHSSLVTIVD